MMKLSETIAPSTLGSPVDLEDKYSDKHTTAYQYKKSHLIFVTDFSQICSSLRLFHLG